AGGVAAAFYPIHMIANLRMGFARMALYNGAIAAARIVAAPLWGRALDRVGARPVLVACCFGLCLSPVLWLFPREGLLWPLALAAARRRGAAGLALRIVGPGARPAHVLGRLALHRALRRPGPARRLDPACVLPAAPRSSAA